MKPSRMVRHLFCTLALSLVASAALFAQRPTPVLIDEMATRGNNCEEMFARLDGFFIELNNNPTDQGYIIIYDDGAYAATRSRHDQVRNHVSMRRFDGARITVVEGSIRDDAKVQFWRVPPGADVPEVLPPTAFRMRREPESDPSAPYIYATEYSDGIPGCAGRFFDLAEYARVLIGEGASGRIVIGESSPAKFRAKSRKVLREIRANGLPGLALRTVYKKVRPNALAEYVELWVVPDKRLIPPRSPAALTAPPGAL